MSTFSRKSLVALRVERRLTQVALAGAAGVGEWTVQAWERGRHAPRPENLLQLAHVLGCQPDDLCEQTPSAQAGGVVTYRKGNRPAGPKETNA